MGSGGVVLIADVGEFGRHGGVSAGQLLDRNVLGLVVGEAQIVVSTNQGVFGFLQGKNRLVDLIDGGLEAAAGEIGVAGEVVLEGFQLILEIGDVDVLGFHQGELCFHFQ